MAQNVIAVYPGTFDPITLGHADIIRRGAKLVDKLTVPIKALGEHKIKIHLHPEVVVEISVLVARSAEEAEFLAKGTKKKIGMLFRNKIKLRLGAFQVAFPK